jgi:hypothetical protein
MRTKSDEDLEAVSRATSVSEDFGEDFDIDVLSAEELDLLPEEKQAAKETQSTSKKITIMFSDLVVKLVEDPTADVSRTWVLRGIFI